VKNGVFPPLRSSIKQHAATLDLTHALNFQVKSNRMIDALTVLTADEVSD
jgi:hypothetical protein